MKKTLMLAAVAALFTIVSCQKEETAAVKDQNGDLIFSATIDLGTNIDPGTKTTVNAETGVVAWVSGDEITITDAASTASKYTVSSIDAHGKATFTKVAGQPSLGDGPYTAVYGTAPATEQTYSATAPALPMSAVSTTTDLTFTVSCGLLELSLTAAESVSSIDVTGTPAGGSETTYTLNCSSPISIASGAKFFIALPAGTYTSFIINAQDGKKCKKKQSGKSVNITANGISPLSLINLHFAVQLWADGPYWAITNVGADTETDYGYYFAWGYAEGYVRNSTNDGWVLASDGTTSRTFNSTGFPDFETHTYSDMAEANWGEGWSLPTDAQFKTLSNTDKSNKCSVEYVKDGTKGIRITGTETGYTSHTIFLPAAGSGLNSNYNSAPGTMGYYWKLEQHSVAQNALFFKLLISPVTAVTQSNSSKFAGYSVRPICTSLQ